jgi:ABC-type transporter Mla subunit MlaD
VSDYETIQRRRNITVGIFVIIAMTSLVWLIYKFGDLPAAVSRLGGFQIVVQFSTAQGVQRDTPVRFCGYQIGRVVEVMRPAVLPDLRTIGGYRQSDTRIPELIIDPNRTLSYYQTRVIIAIDEEYNNIPSNVDVMLMTRGLGSSYIELVVDPLEPHVPLDPQNPATMYLVNNMVLQGSTGVASEFFPAESQKKLDELADSFKTLVDNANDIIGDEENQINLRKTLANLSDATKEATAALQEFRSFAEVGRTTLASADTQTQKLAASVAEMSSEMSKTVAEMRMIFQKINSGEGSAGRLLNDGKLYENLLENTDQLERLLEEVRELVLEYRAKGIKVKL